MSDTQIMEEFKDSDNLFEPYVTNKINNVKVNAPEAPGNPRGVKDMPTDWTKLSSDELKANWSDIVANARAKTKTNQRS